MTARPAALQSPLVDRFGRKHTYLRVSLTDRCNFRCVYCMPEHGVEWKPRAEILTLEEIERLVRLFAQLGITKVRLTGGEPTVRRGFLGLVESIAAIPGIDRVLLTTNGTRLAEYAPKMASAGMKGLNISLDSLRRERFQEITRRDALDEVLAGIEASIKAGLETKINVVVIPGVNDDEILDFVEFASKRPIQVRFIEFMPFLGNEWKPDKVFGYREMLDVIETKFAVEPISRTASDVAKEFRISAGLGTLGFITSMTESFCSDCNRIRLTADGHFKTCLFLPERTSLRDLMRVGADDEQLARVIHADLQTKWAGHPPMHEWRQLDHLTMVQIGG